ncbi:MAG: hypothetical protein MRZ86_05055 [Acidaminococcus sp.]|nr:hypothetical protein [Acidaminococcus sp.]
MKKIIPVILIVVLIIAMAAVLAACNPTTMDKVKGTYKLKVNTVGEQATDLIVKNKIEAYLVVTGGESGYFVYKDSSTPLTVKEVKLTYKLNTDNAEKVEKVTIEDTQGWINDRIGCSNVFFVDKDSTGVRLTYQQKKFGKLIDEKTTTYLKVNDSTNFSYVKSKLGELPATIKNNDASRLHGVWEAVEEGSTTSKFFDFNAATNVVTEYSLKNGSQDIIKTEHAYTVSEFVETETGVNVITASVTIEGVAEQYEITVSEGKNVFFRRITATEPEKTWSDYTYYSTLSELNIESFMLDSNQ